MSALAIVRSDDAVVIASDGAGYEAGTGILRTIVSKVALMPECSCIFANRGAGGATAAMENALRQLAARGSRLITFDDVLGIFPTLAEVLHRELEATPDAQTTHFSFMLGGYSEDRSRMETYTVRTRPYLSPDATGVMVEHPPFRAIALPSIHLAPMPSAEASKAVGITRTQDLQAGYVIEPRAYAAKAVAACRLDRETDDEEGTTGIHFVGGMLQITTLGRNWTSSEIIHRWPDPIGEPMNPENGNLLPDYLKPENHNS